jgi:hypothetical protein
MYSTGTVHQSSKIKKVKKMSQKQLKTKFFSNFCLFMEGSGAGSVQIIKDPDPLGSKTYGSYEFGTLVPALGV